MEALDLSVVIPAKEEQDNVEPLIEELDGHLHDSGLRWETIAVDDGSKDATLARLNEIRCKNARLRVLSLLRHRGKSAAMAAGISEATGLLVGFLDADLQNRPCDLVAMTQFMLANQEISLVQGHRDDRCDSPARRLASRIGFIARAAILGDRTKDAGCGLRVIRRTAALRLPLDFEGMHRFLPSLVTMSGGRVVEMPVRHRPRHRGRSKYGVGPLSRGCGGWLDLLAVRWMLWRYRGPHLDESGSRRP